MNKFSFILINFLLLFQSCKNNEDISVEWINSYVSYCHTPFHTMSFELEFKNNTDKDVELFFYLEGFKIITKDKEELYAIHRSDIYPFYLMTIKSKEVGHFSINRDTDICTYDSLKWYQDVTLIYKPPKRALKQPKKSYEVHNTEIILDGTVIRKSKDYKIYRPGNYPERIMRNFEKDSISFFEQLNEYIHENDTQ